MNFRFVPYVRVLLMISILSHPPSNSHGSPTATSQPHRVQFGSHPCSLISCSTFTLNLHNITSFKLSFKCWSGVARLPSPSIIFISCPYHSHLRKKKEQLCPPPASKYNVTADQYHRAETCQYAELSSSLEAHRLFRVRHRPPCLALLGS